MPLSQEEYNELLKYCMAQRFKYTISDLKSMAKKKNIKGYYRMNKELFAENYAMLWMELTGLNFSGIKMIKHLTKV